MGMSHAASQAIQHSAPHTVRKGQTNAMLKTKGLSATSFFFFLSIRKLYPLYRQVLAFRVTIQERFTDKTGVYHAFQQVNYLISSRIPVLKRLHSEALNVVKC